jgi:uncharacterized protein YbaP (TraB family)
MHRIWIATLVVVVACRGDERRPERGREAVVETPQLAKADDPWAGNKKPLGPPAVTDPLPHPFAWGVTKDGKTSTFFGTMHAGVSADERIPTWVWKRFDAATTLVTEVDMKDLELSTWTIRPPGPTLRDELGEEYWSKLEGMAGPAQAAMLNLGSTAMAAMRVSGYGSVVPDTAPMDGMLRLRAEEHGKQLVFLEPAKQQGQMLTALNDLTSLRTLIDNRERLSDLNRQFFAAYENGDAEKLAVLGSESFRAQSRDPATHARILSTLVYERNRAWLPEIERLHGKGDAFFAVGVLHLVGEHNVLELLVERGYTVVRLESL